MKPGLPELLRKGISRRRTSKRNSMPSTFEKAVEGDF
jgi:hypothetical protein